MCNFVKRFALRVPHPHLYGVLNPISYIILFLWRIDSYIVLFLWRIDSYILFFDQKYPIFLYILGPLKIVSPVINFSATTQDRSIFFSPECSKLISLSLKLFLKIDILTLRSYRCVKLKIVNYAQNFV